LSTWRPWNFSATGSMGSGNGAFQAQSTSGKCALARGTRVYPASSSTIATTVPWNAMDSVPRNMFGCNFWMTDNKCHYFWSKVLSTQFFVCDPSVSNINQFVFSRRCKLPVTGSCHLFLSLVEVSSFDHTAPYPLSEVWCIQVCQMNANQSFWVERNAFLSHPHW
jgi:hypothetical protein